ncbi:hypothetical protein SAMN02746042_00680 [Fructilactobacillus lindneri DSM 20690 = JCM 11027]|nr:hypothetical protein SAMN02746042_00680 [Fructilactobacillus lindneri DSM 20690 = JCM 11027]
MKYFIFLWELVCICLWIIYGHRELWIKIIGIIFIIACSQFAHIIFKVR